MRQRRSLRIFGRFSGFLLVNCAALAHRLGRVWQNKHALVALIRDMGARLEKSKAQGAQVMSQLRRDFERNQSEFNRLDADMKFRMDRMAEHRLRMERARNLETVRKYWWRAKWN